MQGLVPEGSSIFQSNLPLQEKLERARTELLDLSARNRLLNIPRSSKAARTIEVVDEKASEVFRLLVSEGKALTFLPGKTSRAADGVPGDEEDEEVADLAQPEDDGVDERGVANRHGDTRLQTRMTSKGLQKRLLDLYTDARTLEEEQGTNILFLALGTLKWVDPNNKANVRFAPLILVPVRLERAKAGERFKLRWRGEEQSSNLSLEAFLDRLHHLALPHLDAGDDFDPTAYLAAVADAVSTKEGWEVQPDDIVLGFFSFSKFLMYRDLDPAMWPARGDLASQPLIRGLVADGFPGRGDLLPEDAHVDHHIQPADLLHIVDADSSQTLAIHDVRAGRDLVIQGPPGTGKSQTIANVIAAAVADGKTVLFVAEKMTALEVVKRRLDNAGVGDACLELHSNKANKRAFLEELKRTWALGSPRGDTPDLLNDRLHAARDGLNGHAERMHAKHPNAGLTPFQVIGHLTRLRRGGARPGDVRLERPEAWSGEERRQREDLVREVAQRIDDIGLPANHPWRGVGLDYVLPMEVERLLGDIGTTRARLGALAAAQADLARVVAAEEPRSIGGFDPVAVLARRLAGAPDLAPGALADPAWQDQPDRIRSLIAAGTGLKELRKRLDGVADPSAWTTPVGEARALLATLPTTFSARAFGTVAQLAVLLPRLLAEAEGLRSHLGMQGAADTPAEVTHVVVMGERVADAPDASPVAFAATVWDRGVDQAGDLADAVAALERARAEVAGWLTDAAWDADLRQARQVLATNTGVTRLLSGEWRRSNNLVRSVLARADAPLPEILAALDGLAKGQVALAAIREGDAFGRAAFGEDWRGPKSGAAPLQALVAWMRSLRGLGAEPRLIAGRMPDRSRITDRARATKALLGQVRPMLAELRSALGGDAATDDLALEELASWATRVAEANAACAGVLTQVPELLPERLARLDQITLAQRALTALRALDGLARAAFGPAWAGDRSDWRPLSEAAEWIAGNSDIRLLAARLPDRREPAQRAEVLSRDAAALGCDVGRLLDALRTDVATLFGGGKLEDLSFEDLDRRLGTWLASGEALSKWVAYVERAGKGRAWGIGDVVARMEDGRLPTAEAQAAFEMAYYEALFSDQAGAAPAIARFDGQLHEGLRRKFAELDQQRIAAARLEVVRAHHRRIPTATGGAGPLGVLRAEIARRRGHMPIRQLMSRAAPAVQALKPVMMMSPLSVAQFLPPGQVAFDLLVMDEASQIQPVDALGAIARCGKVVVVGDERQLPPTRFFSRLTSNQPEGDEEDGAQVADIESILGLFTARGLPQRMLRWHYRSRHQSLIAVSNSQFYDNKLFIVPSPYTQEAGMGLRFHHVPDGVFDAGGTSANAVEARRVAEAIVRHAREHPGESLGVATFSIAQRKAIQDQLEVLRRLNPEAEDFFHAHPGEPFFLKSLENVQGDERDVIMISVGYGRNSNGTMAMRFGPLGAEGGERRLNVLISRAKRRCEVFASFTDEDVDLERGKGKGVFAFKLFLHFARTGRLSMAQATGREHDSPFEVQVANALVERGYQVHAQVGIAGFFIDLAIADHERPGRYLIGVECDGAAYHSSRSARDRDRLRQSVLEDHGWIIHRIWSTDWFQRPQEQLERTVAAIEAAKQELDGRMERGGGHARAVPVEIVTVDRGDVTEIGLVASGGTAPEESNVYVEATARPPRGGQELHDVPADVLAQVIEEVVRVEGPVHVDEVTARLKAAWGVARAGSRIQANVERGVALAARANRLALDRGFLSVPGSEVRVRDRSGASSSSLRRPDMLPPAEVKVAAVAVARTNFGAAPDEIVQGVARAFGYKLLGSQLRECIRSVLDAMIEAGELVRSGDLLVMPEAVVGRDQPATIH